MLVDHVEFAVEGGDDEAFVELPDDLEVLEVVLFDAFGGQLSQLRT